MPLQNADELARAHIPKADQPVLASRSDHPAARVPTSTSASPRRMRQAGQHFSRFQVAELYRIVPAAIDTYGESATIWSNFEPTLLSPAGREMPDLPRCQINDRDTSVVHNVGQFGAVRGKGGVSAAAITSAKTHRPLMPNEPAHHQQSRATVR